MYPWQQICDVPDSKFTLSLVSCLRSCSSFHVEDGKIHEGRTKAVLSQITDNDNVAVNCLPSLKRVGLIVDAMQAAGIMSCSVTDIQPAMKACSIHKWLRGPIGASLVYVDPEWHDVWMPLDQHGRSRVFSRGQNWDAYGT